MTTLVSPEMQSYANQDNALSDYPSSVFSGIVGDLAHRDSNTYHFSIEDLKNPATGTYTNKWPDDAAPPGNWSRKHASASDKSMSTADMVREWNRWIAVYNNRHNDPRAKYVAEYIGWNGVGTAERLDFQAGTRASSTPDHKWHSHKARRRRYYNDPQATRAMLSIDRGETIAQYVGGDSEVSERLEWLAHQFETLENHYPPTVMEGRETKFITKFLALLDDVAEIKARPSASLTPEQVSQIAQEVASEVVQNPANNLTDEDIPTVADAVANKLASRLSA